VGQLRDGAGEQQCAVFDAAAADDDDDDADDGLEALRREIIGRRAGAARTHARALK
jgi:hypothetical protein